MYYGSRYDSSNTDRMILASRQRDLAIYEGEAAPPHALYDVEVIAFDETTTSLNSTAPGALNKYLLAACLCCVIIGFIVGRQSRSTDEDDSDVIVASSE